MDDYSAYIDKGNLHNRPIEMQNIIDLAQQQIKTERNIVRIEEELKHAKAHLAQISEIDLPAQMEDLGLPEFKLPDGVKIQVSEKIRASVSIERRPAATQWLEEHNAGGLLKTEVVVPFGRGEIEEAKELVKKLMENNRLANLERTVHPQTLNAYVREQLAEGKDIPVDLFGISRQRVSKITLPK